MVQILGLDPAFGDELLGLGEELGVVVDRADGDGDRCLDGTLLVRRVPIHLYFLDY